MCIFPGASRGQNILDSFNQGLVELLIVRGSLGWLGFSDFVGSRYGCSKNRGKTPKMDGL